MAIFHNIFDDFVQHQRLQTSQRRAQRPGDHSPRPRHRPKSRYHGVLALPNRQPTSHPGGQRPQRDQRKIGRNHQRHPPANGFYGLIQRPPLQQPQPQQQSNQSTMTQVFNDHLNSSGSNVLKLSIEPTDSEEHPSSSSPPWQPPPPTHHHGPGNFAPEHMPAIHTTSKQKPTKPSKPIAVGIQDTQQNALGSLLGDLAYLSISNQPFFNQFVPVQHWPNKDFVKKPEYQYLHQLPAELLQDIESEPLESPKLPDHAIIDNFRKVYDDFHTRIRGTSSLTGKKKVPETRPYVLFLMVYDLCKREAKRLALQEVEVSFDFVWTFEQKIFNIFERKNG